MSQAPALSGTPEAGHCSRAATRASCASSSAVPMSPTMRDSPAMSWADSIRQIASMARSARAAIVSARPGSSGASPARGAMARASSRALVHGDLADLEGPAVVGCPPEPLDGLVHRAHIPQPVSGHELLGLREGPIDDRALLAVEPKALALRAWVKAAVAEHHPGLDQLFVERLELRQLLWGWGRRRPALMVFLCQHQHTHDYLLSIGSDFEGSWTLPASPRHRMAYSVFDIGSSGFLRDVCSWSARRTPEVARRDPPL